MRIEPAQHTHRAMLREHFERLVGLKNLSMDSLEVALVRMSARETLIAPGARHPYLYIVLEGIMRVAVTTEDGAERVTHLVERGQTLAVPMMYRSAWMGNIQERTPAVSQVLDEHLSGPPPYLVSSLKAATMLRVSYEQLERLAANDGAWAAVLVHHLTVFAAVTEARNIDLLTLNPERRYHKFMKRRGHLVGQVPKKDIASLLGITPESLSRIRARTTSLIPPVKGLRQIS